MKFRIAALVGATLVIVGCGISSKSTDIPDATTPPTAVATTATPVTTTPTAKPLSAEQQNANKAARNYLDGQTFSRKSLIDQLKYEGYSTKAATVAVDSLHADWKAEAARSAKSYLESQSFSRKSLIDQLEYEGFTHDQAVYGVSKTGL